uniref:Malonyl-CoA:ACP transacylase (MAT) domain-containing protein n=1 Tax=Pyrodinium bahamense TaxID=73915 RepID=A0A7S0AGE5_9DINO
MPDRAPKQTLESFCQVCFDGDLTLLTQMLDSEDPINGFQGDINEHLQDYTALHYAAVNGQTECVEALLKARADPHMKTRMPKGKGPTDGRTAMQVADDWGWDDIVAILKAAEAKESKGDYILGGPLNNAKIYPSGLSATGRDPAQVKRVTQKVSSTCRPYFLEVLEHPSSVGLMFPGQGSQYVNMLSGVKDMPAVKEMLATARDILGWDALDVCLHGPGSKLDQTEFCNPLLFIGGLAGLEKLKQEVPEAASRPGAVAGLGVGDLTALVAAGVLTFRDGLKVVKARAEALKEASATGEAQALLSVAGMRRDKLEGVCRQVRDEIGSSATCYISSVLFPRGATCGGTRTAMERLERLAKANGALQAKLTTSLGALHTPLMAPAAAKFEAALREASVRMSPPKCDVYMNCTGGPVYAGSSPHAIIPLLVRQLTEPVLWEAVVKAMIQAGISEFYEVGPMKQLKAMMKRIDGAMFERTTNVEV